MGEKIKNKLNFFVPLSFEKAKDKDSGDEYIKVKGVASTRDEDSDQEVLEPSGYKTERLVKYGLINFNHNQKDILGHVTKAKVDKDKLHLEGVLYPEVKDVDKIVHIASVLEKKGAGRRLGWSIEGKATKRDPFNPKRVLQADLHGAALTFTPKNYNTWATIIKGEYNDSYIESEYDEEIHGGKEYLLDITRPDGVNITVDKNFNIKVKKAMSATHQTGRELIDQATSGAALKEESIDKKLKILTNRSNSIKVLSKNIDKFTKKGKCKIKKSILSFLN